MEVKLVYNISKELCMTNQHIKTRGIQLKLFLEGNIALNAYSRKKSSKLMSKTYITKLENI